MEVVHAHIAKIAVPPSGCPQILADIIMTLMAKMPENRYQSALGLHADLQRCQERFVQNKRLTAFELRQHDIVTTFQIPSQFYGRKDEIARLMEGLERLNSNSAANRDHTTKKAEIILVSGEAGISKSSFVHEVCKRRVLNHNYFVKGKFDQLLGT